MNHFVQELKYNQLIKTKDVHIKSKRQILTFKKVKPAAALQFSFIANKWLLFQWYHYDDNCTAA